jgi:hypothetical protein
MRRTHSFAVGAVAFIVYWLTLCPTVSIGDSGEFITNAVTLGINHTTGYPLYTLITSCAVRLLFFVTPAFAVNMVSALYAAAAAVFVFRTVRLLTEDDVAAFGAALMFSFSLTVWSAAVVAEVYSLTLFGLSLILFLIVDWYRSGEPRTYHIPLIAYLSGLLLTQHTVTVLVLFCIAGFIFSQPKRAFGSVAGFFYFIALFGLGASVYLYLPVRSSGDPPLDWLNPETFDNLMDFFFPFAKRKVVMYDAEGLANRALWIGRRLLTEEMWYFAPIAGFAVPWMKKHKRIAALLLGIIALSTSFAIIRRQPVEGDFASLLLPSILAMVIFIGIGFSALRKDILQTQLRQDAVFITFILCFPAAVAALHWDRCDMSANRFGEELAGHLLNGVEPDALLFVQGDEQTFLPWYYKYVDGRYAGLTVVNWDFLNTQWHSEAVGNELTMNLQSLTGAAERARLILKNVMQKRPVYFLQQLPFEWITREYSAVPIGFIYRIVERSDTTVHPAAMNPVPTLHPSMDERSQFLLNYYPRMHFLNAVVLLDMNRPGPAEEELLLLRDYRIPSRELKKEQEKGRILLDSLQTTKQIK